MIGAPASIAGLLWHSLLQPAQVAQALVALHLPRNALWMALALSTVLGVLVQTLLPLPLMPVDSAGPSPLTTAVTLGSMLVLFAVVLAQTAALLGGHGSLDGAILTVAWTEAFGSVLRGALWLVAPMVGQSGFAAVLAVSLVAMLWLSTAFIMVTQGFASRLRAAMVLGLAVLGLLVGLALILGAIGALVGGFAPQGD